MICVKVFTCMAGNSMVRNACIISVDRKVFCHFPTYTKPMIPGFEMIEVARTRLAFFFLYPNKEMDKHKKQPQI